MNREDDVAGTTERTTSAIVRPNCPARSRLMLMSIVGIVEFLGKLQIAQERQLRHLVLDFLRIGVIVLKIDSHDRHFDRSRRAKTHNLTHNVRRFKRHASNRAAPARGCWRSLSRRSSPRGVFSLRET